MHCRSGRSQRHVVAHHRRGAGESDRVMSKTLTAPAKLRANRKPDFSPIGPATAGQFAAACWWVWSPYLARISTAVRPKIAQSGGTVSDCQLVGWTNPLVQTAGGNTVLGAHVIIGTLPGFGLPCNRPDARWSLTLSSASYLLRRFPKAARRASSGNLPCMPIFAVLSPIAPPPDWAYATS